MAGADVQTRNIICLTFGQIYLAHTPDKRHYTYLFKSGRSIGFYAEIQIILGIANIHLFRAECPRYRN